MFKALWAVAVVGVVALGISIFATVINTNEVRAQSARVSAVSRQELRDRREIVRLRAEVRAMSAARQGTP